jgi:hypothetical protein
MLIAPCMGAMSILMRMSTLKKEYFKVLKMLKVLIAEDTAAMSILTPSRLPRGGKSRPARPGL